MDSTPSNGAVDRDVHWAVEQLNTAFAHHIDHGEAEALGALFTETAVYVSGDRRVEGRAGIVAHFRARADAQRVSRHLFSSLRVHRRDAATLGAVSVWISFAGNGVPPLAMPPPFMIADFHDVYEGTPDGWRISQRLIRPVFNHLASAPAATALREIGRGASAGR